MIPLKTIMGKVAVIDRPNIDTDQIIPKQFLKRIERTGYENYLFFNWRYLENGGLNPEFELNNPRFKDAKILLAGENFGCGSSREHAAWALFDYGIRAIISPSFAEIFHQNAFKNGLLPIKVSTSEYKSILASIEANEPTIIAIDLETQHIIYDDGNQKIPFSIPEDKKNSFICGLDEIDITLKFIEEIKQYESHREKLKFLNEFMKKRTKDEV